MRRPTMTIRRAMIAVAVAAVLIAIWARDLPARRRSYLADAAYHARREAEERQLLATLEQARREGKIPPRSRSWANAEASLRVRIPYYSALKEKYRRAASHPWETPGPDPSDPGEDLVWRAMEIDDLDVTMPSHISDLPWQNTEKTIRELKAKIGTSASTTGLRSDPEESATGDQSVQSKAQDLSESLPANP